MLTVSSILLSVAQTSIIHKDFKTRHEPNIKIKIPKIRPPPPPQKKKQKKNLKQTPHLFALLFNLRCWDLSLLFTVIVSDSFLSHRSLLPYLELGTAPS